MLSCDTAAEKRQDNNIDGMRVKLNEVTDFIINGNFSYLCM